MKKAFFLALTVALALGIVGCGNGATSKKQKELLKMTDQEIGQKLIENNNDSKIVAAGEYIVSDTQRIPEQDQYTWVIGDQFLYFSADGVETVYDHGEEYGLFDGSTFYRVRVLDDELREYEYEIQCGYALTKYTLEDDERRVLFEKAGENLRYAILVPLTDNDGEYFSEIFGADSTKYRELKEVMTIDPDTFRILDSCKYVVDDSGEETLLTTYQKKYLSENPIEEEVAALHEKCYGGDNYTIKIIVGQGTDREKVYETTINKDVYLDLWVRDADRNYVVYTDPEFTNVYPYDENDMLKFSGDMTLYMK